MRYVRTPATASAAGPCGIAFVASPGTLTTAAYRIAAGAWGTLAMDAAAPDGTGISVSVLDASTGAIVPGVEGMSGPNVDLGGFSATDYPALRFAFTPGEHLAASIGYERTLDMYEYREGRFTFRLLVAW